MCIVICLYKTYSIIQTSLTTQMFNTNILVIHLALGHVIPLSYYKIKKAKNTVMYLTHNICIIVQQKIVSGKRNIEFVLDRWMTSTCKWQGLLRAPQKLVGYHVPLTVSFALKRFFYDKNSQFKVCNLCFNITKRQEPEVLIRKSTTCLLYTSRCV